MRDVRAALLAGGQGERMGRLTDKTPKPMVPYGGCCRLVDFSVANAVRSGVREMVVMSRHRERDLLNHLLRRWDGRGGLHVHLGPHESLLPGLPGLSDPSPLPDSSLLSDASGISGQFDPSDPYGPSRIPSPPDNSAKRRGGLPPGLVLPTRPAELGTADALLANAEWVFAPGARDVLILHADHVYRFDYRPMLQAHREAAADATIGVQRIERRFVSLFGMVEVDRDNRVLLLVEKPSEPTSNLVFTAFCLFRADALGEVLAAFARLPPTQWRHDISHDVLPFMIAQGHRVMAFPVGGYWADIGTVERYLLGHMDLIRSQATLTLKDIPRTLPGARPAFVRHKRVVTSAPLPPQAHLRETVVYPGCVVEAGARVERSVLLPGAHVRAGAEICDTVVLQQEVIAGTRTGLGDLT